MSANRITSRRVRRFTLIGCVVLWLCAFTATHIPINQISLFPSSDKTLHFLGFFGLTAAFLLTLILHGLKPKRRIIVVLVSMILYAAFDELTQPLFNRYAAWGDWLADIAGAAAAVVLLELLMVARKKLAKPQVD